MTDLIENDLPIRLFGHSLGGAVMGDSIFGQDLVFDQIILYGTLSFIQSHESQKITASDVQFLVGENDGLSINNATDLTNFIEKYQFTKTTQNGEYRIEGTPHSFQLIPDLSHFCIVNDMTAGLDFLRKRDHEGPSPQACIHRLSQYFIERGWL